MLAAICREHMRRSLARMPEQAERAHLHVGHHLPGLLEALAGALQLLGAAKQAVSVQCAVLPRRVCLLPEQLRAAVPAQILLQQSLQLPNFCLIPSHLHRW